MNKGAPLFFAQADSTFALGIFGILELVVPAWRQAVSAFL
jgi:hypothetical protein